MSVPAFHMPSSGTSHTCSWRTGSQACSDPITSSGRDEPRRRVETPVSDLPTGERQPSTSTPSSVNRYARWMVGMYARPVSGLYDIACQLWPPIGPGEIRAGAVS